MERRKGKKGKKVSWEKWAKDHHVKEKGKKRDRERKSMVSQIQIPKTRRRKTHWPEKKRGKKREP